MTTFSNAITPPASAFTEAVTPPASAFVACGVPPDSSWGPCGGDPVATSLEIATQPAGAVGGAVLGTSPVVRVVDQFGALFPVDGLDITVSVDLYGLSGTLTVPTVGGVATFADLVLADTPWTPASTRTLAFTAAGMAAVSAAPIVVALGDDLGAWYRTDAAQNVFSHASPAALVAMADLSGNGNDLTVLNGIVTRVLAMLNGRDGLDFSTLGANYLSNVILPVEGSLTWFGVFKITPSATYQNLFDAIANAQAWLFWDQPTDRWQVDGRLAGSASVTGVFVTVVLHFFNVAGAMQIKMRVNGTQILSQAATAPATPVPGAVGAPVNKTFTSFHRATGQFPFKSQILEWGYYRRAKDGSEGGANGPETHLRADYATW